MPDLFILTDAIISDCGRYRYTLTRTWDKSLPPLVWVMLNPSVADHAIDDPTIRRVVSFTRGFGYGSAVVVNLYALRATDPKALWKAPDPVGPENDRHLIDTCAGNFVVAAWGTNAKPGRVAKVMSLIRSNALCIDCLGTTAAGAPKHPLYIKADTNRVPFSG